MRRASGGFGVVAAASYVRLMADQPPPPTARSEPGDSTQSGVDSVSLLQVPQRMTALTVSSLGIECTAKEMPHPVDKRADGYFIASGQLRTSLPVIDHATGEPLPAGSVELWGITNVAIFDRKLAAIIGPPENGRPAIWLVVSLPPSKVAAVGSQGLIKRRPRAIQVATAELALELSEVHRFWPNREAVQPWQEKSLLDMVGDHQRHA